MQVEAEPLQEQLRQMAISLLCGMVHSTWSTRMALWNCNGLHTLLDLLKEEVSLHSLAINAPKKQGPL